MTSTRPSKIIKSILPIVVPFEPNIWGSSKSVGSLKSILAFEMIFRSSNTWGSSKAILSSGNDLLHQNDQTH